MEIITPCKEYLNSYYEGCLETWGHVFDDYIIHDPKKFDEWKDTIFQDYYNNENGINLPTGFLPSITKWIIDDGKYIGTLNIRPQLNDALRTFGGSLGIFIRLSERKKGYAKKALEMTCQEMVKMNISPILLTCATSNTNILKTMKHISGIEKEEIDTVIYKDKPTEIVRFWMNL